MTAPAKRIYEWKAARSGAFLTIKGRNILGEPMMVTGVAFLELEEVMGCRVVAVTKLGERIECRMGRSPGEVDAIRV